MCESLMIITNKSKDKCKNWSDRQPCLIQYLNVQYYILCAFSAIAISSGPSKLQAERRVSERTACGHHDHRTSDSNQTSLPYIHICDIDQQIHFGLMNVILLHNDNRHVSATHVAFFRVVRARIKIHLFCRDHYVVNNRTVFG